MRSFFDTVATSFRTHKPLGRLPFLLAGKRNIRSLDNELPEATIPRLLQDFMDKKPVGLFVNVLTFPSMDSSTVPSGRHFISYSPVC